jgi:HPt (histidine-containing phosphotransfer) domain-containing protein
MAQTQSARPAIHSSLASDPLLSEMVQQFVAEMPNRVALLERQFDAGDWQALKRAAHQLKGAAGSYGFDELTPHALRLETLIAARASKQEIAAATSELIAHCRRVTAAVSAK